MGMYTEISLRLNFKADTPAEVISLLGSMKDGDIFTPEFNPKLPKHALFSTEGWGHMLCSCSYYHVPFAAYKIEIDTRGYSMVGRSDFKNYNNEVNLFFDWILPYAEEGMMGYSLYEEDTVPTIYIKEGDKLKVVDYHE